MISAAMPEIIVQNIFSGIGSVIFTEINYPKHFFRSVYFFVGDGNLLVPNSNSFQTKGTRRPLRS